MIEFSLWLILLPCDNVSAAVDGAVPFVMTSWGCKHKHRLNFGPTLRLLSDNVDPAASVWSSVSALSEANIEFEVLLKWRKNLCVVNIPLTKCCQSLRMCRWETRLNKTTSSKIHVGKTDPKHDGDGAIHGCDGSGGKTTTRVWCKRKLWVMQFLNWPLEADPKVNPSSLNSISTRKTAFSIQGPLFYIWIS